MRRSMKRFDSINVIPFIDIMLVLLAIVLTTASFIASGKLDISVPQSSSTETLLPHAPSKISIDKNLTIFWNEEPISLENLDQKIAVLDKQQAIIFRVDKTVAFQSFTNILDLLKKHHVEKLSIVTEQKNET